MTTTATTPRPNNTTGDELVSPAGRLAALDLTDRRCPVCERRMWLHCSDKRDQITVDHLEAWSGGGENGWQSGNLVPLCGSCNYSKRDRDFAEWLPERLVSVGRCSTIRGAHRRARSLGGSLVERKTRHLQAIAVAFVAILEKTEN